MVLKFIGKSTPISIYALPFYNKGIKVNLKNSILQTIYIYKDNNNNYVHGEQLISTNLFIIKNGKDYFASKCI